MIIENLKKMVNTMEIEEFCRKLPKIELQANLMCSLSKQTIQKLYYMRKRYDPLMANFEAFSFLFEVSRFQEENKQLLGFIRMLLDTQECLYEAILDVIKQYQADNTIYLELRPFVLSHFETMTKEEYISYVIDCVCLASTIYPQIIVKVIFVISQSHIPEECRKTCDIVLKYHTLYPEIVIGIDVHSDALKCPKFRTTLKQYQRDGLRIVIDCYKINNHSELMKVIEFEPDRLNNCTGISPYTGGTEYLFNKLLKSYIPIEICLTFNVAMQIARKYSDLHLYFFYKHKHPISICAGRTEILETTLSNEYAIAAINLNLSKSEILDMCISSIMQSFASEKEKCKMADILREFEKTEQLEMNLF